SARARTRRWRERRLREVFRGLVRPCGGPGQCLWRMATGAADATTAHQARQGGPSAAEEVEGGAAGADGLLDPPPLAECRCVRGRPCKCEREIRGFIERRAASYLGEVPGAVLCDAILDLLRSRVMAKDDDVRT